MTAAPIPVARIYRYEVPVDDNWHTVSLSGGILHVACRRPDVVELWAATDGKEDDVELTVVGTGHPYPVGEWRDHRWHAVRPVGTAIVPGGALVWHLLRRDPTEPVYW